MAYEEARTLQAGLERCAYATPGSNRGRVSEQSVQGVIETGWLLQDAGDVGLDAAAGWSRRAAEWARCAGDTRMAAYMLIRQANIATLTARSRWWPRSRG